jgi:hypothetical protein
MPYLLEFTGYLACNQQLAKNGGDRNPPSPQSPDAEGGAIRGHCCAASSRERSTGVAQVVKTRKVCLR